MAILGKGLGGLLDLSPAARLGRADDQGFRLNMPLFHGTAKDFSSFDFSKGGDVSGSPVGSLGVSLGLDPGTAGEFASLAANQGGGGGENIIQVFHKAENPGTIDLDGSESNLEIASTVREAWDQGFDAIKFNNYTTPGGAKGKSFILVKEPNQVRSVNAKFDPANKESSKLLAGVGAGLSPLGGFGLVASGLAGMTPRDVRADDLQRMTDSITPFNVNAPNLGFRERSEILPVQGNPELIKAAQFLQRFTDTPIGPLLGGVADALNKIGVGEPLTAEDYINATLDFL